MIDLRSDTVTRPTPAMLDAMMSAKVGDDMFGEDPTTNALQARAAKMFGKEAALFCSSGVQANQIAIKVHTRPGDQVICSDLAHIYHYEGGGIAMNSGCSVKMIHNDRLGRFSAEEVAAHINEDDQHFPKSALVCLEDTVNKGGGAVWSTADIAPIATLCQSRNLRLHVDGARLFNALVATGESTQDYGHHFDSISICLSKGLGAPIGSLLLGDRDFISQAIRVRKVFGGAMRQTGYLAAAGLHALDHHIDRLAIDHHHAQQVAEVLSQSRSVSRVIDVETNILLFDLRDDISPATYLAKLHEAGISAFATGPQRIRFVFHLDVSSADVDRLMTTIRSIN